MAIAGDMGVLEPTAGRQDSLVPGRGLIAMSPDRIAGVLVVVALGLVFADITTQMARLYTSHAHLYGLTRLFNLDYEQNIPAWFSSGLLALAALLLASIAALEWSAMADRLRWTSLAAGFLLMSLDESASLHELLIEPVRGLLGQGHLGLFYFAWVVPAIAVVAALGLYFLPFLRRLPPATARLFVLSAAVYLGGALGVEMIEGWFREAHGSRNLAYTLLVCLEEGMEMLGAIAFIYALLGYVSSRHPTVQLRLARAAQDGH